MSTVFLSDPRAEPVRCPERQGHANLALRCILEAEIEALQSRLQQRSAKSAVARGLARVDLDRQVAWLRDGVAKLQARLDALLI